MSDGGARALALAASWRAGPASAILARSSFSSPPPTCHTSAHVPVDHRSRAMKTPHACTTHAQHVQLHGTHTARDAHVRLYVKGRVKGHVHGLIRTCQQLQRQGNGQHHWSCCRQSLQAPIPLRPLPYPPTLLLA
eukprot:3544455-Rhodomonas_salina.1